MFHIVSITLLEIAYEFNARDDYFYSYSIVLLRMKSRFLILKKEKHILHNSCAKYVFKRILNFSISYQFNRFIRSNLFCEG